MMNAGRLSLKSVLESSNKILVEESTYAFIKQESTNEHDFN